MQSHVDLLMVDPASRQAIDGFMNLCQQTDKVSLAKQALCICLHLDVAGEDRASGPLWINLAGESCGTLAVIPETVAASHRASAKNVTPQIRYGD